MIKVTTFFKNRVTAANLIFRDTENKGVNIIYMPELGSSGINFINKYRKKNYWDYVIIPMPFTFLAHKVYTNNYLKDFKKNIPMIRIQRKFIKSGNTLKSVVVDLTPLSENFASYTKSRSKKQTMDALFELVQKFAIDSAATEKLTYLLIDNVQGDEKEIVDALFYYARLNNNKLRIQNIEGIILTGNKRFWPLTTQDEDKDGKYLKLNINIFGRYMKEVHGEEEHTEITPEVAIAQTRETVKALYKVHRDKLKATSANISGAAKKSDDIQENPLDLIKNEVMRNPHLTGKNFEEKLSNLFDEKEIQKSKKDVEKIPEVTKKDKKEVEIVKQISKDMQELQLKFNGAIELNEKVVQKSANTFYNPFNIIGFNTFNAYNKQDTEFGDNLDQAIFDLIKSIEADKELGINVLNIKTEITDTNRDRFKTYRIKLQHKEFGYTKPYTVSFHVPIPSKGKYLKLGGNDWIMINQFFPKPVVKTDANTVKMYTHYSTAAVFLKTHALNAENDIKELIDDFSSSLKRTKKLKVKPQKLESDEANKIIQKYNLPDYINPDIFTKLEIK